MDSTHSALKRSGLGLPIMASLTLGLAPFVPEPHVWGKVRWVAGGANGMSPMDWFDLALHGSPWVWLAWSLANLALIKAKAAKAEA